MLSKPRHDGVGIGRAQGERIRDRSVGGARSSREGSASDFGGSSRSPGGAPRRLRWSRPGPPLLPPKQREGGLGIRDHALLHPIQRVVDFRLDHLEVLAGVELRPHVAQLRRHVELDHLGRITDGRVDRHEVDPLVGFVAALLHQLALGRGKRRLAGLELAGGNLHEVALLRIAVLALEEDRVRRREGEDHDGPGVLHVLAPGRVAVVQPHLVAIDLEEAAVVGELRGDGGFGEVRGELRRLRHVATS